MTSQAHASRAPTLGDPIQTSAELASTFTELVSESLDSFDSSMPFTMFRSVINANAAMYPRWLVQSVGSFLHTHRQAIINGDVAHFVDMDYRDQRADWIAIARSTRVPGVTMIMDRVINAVENTIRSSVHRLVQESVDDSRRSALALLITYDRYCDALSHELIEA